MTAQNDIEQNRIQNRNIKTISLRNFFSRFVLLCVVPLFGLGVSLSTVYLFNLQEQLHMAAQTQATNVMTSIDRDLSARIAALQVMTQSPLLDSSNLLDKFYIEAQGFRKSFTGNVILADLDGQMLFNTRSPFGTVLPVLPIPKGFAAAPYVLKTGEPAVGDMFMGPIAHEYLIAVVVPVKEEETVKALLLSIVETRQYQNLIEDFQISEGFTITLLDSKDEVLAQRPQSGLGEIPAQNNSLRRFVKESSISHWSIRIEVPRLLYYKPLIFTGGALLLFMLLVSVISIVIGNNFGLIITKAIESLVESQEDKPEKIHVIEIEHIRNLLRKTKEANLAAEREIRESEALYRNLFESANVGKSITYPTGEIYVNKSFSNMLGYKQEFLQHKSWQELTPPEEIEPIKKMLEQLLNGTEDSIRFTKRYIHKNGSYIWADVSTVICRDSDNNPLYFITTIVDISKKAQIENQLANALNYIQTIFDNSPIGIATFKDDGEIVTMNRSLIEIVGGTSEQLVGLNIHNLDSWKTSGMLTTAEQVLESGVDIKQEFQYVSNFGKECWVSALFVSFFHENNKQLLLLLTDIREQKQTESIRKKLQEKLIQSQKLESLGLLAGGIAHDFNNMIGGILNTAQLLKSPKRNLDEKGLKYANLIIRASKRAADLTSKLLTFGRKGKMVSANVDIHSIIDETASILYRSIDKKISIQIEKEAENYIIFGESSGLQNGLFNLCINASQAMPDGGEIIIRTKNVRLSKKNCDESSFELEPGEYCRIEISDTGLGIPLENMHKIFEPFFTTKEQGTGTGLGLSAVYGTVLDHHGSINVYSELGQGTVFQILLPCSGYYPEEEEDVEKIITGNANILLVDDEEIFRVSAQNLLESMGYNVVTAENGKEAVEIYKTQFTEIDLVLMDMIMPVKNGREAFFEMKKINKDCKIILSSGFTKNENITELEQSGLNGFIRKPYIEYNLSKLLSDILSTSEE